MSPIPFLSCETHLYDGSGMISDNQSIGDEGAMRMAEALERNTSLVELDLYCIPQLNQIISSIHAYEHFQDLCAHSHMDSYDYMWLGCGISEIGGERLIQAMNINTTLNDLSLLGMFHPIHTLFRPY
jgi:hypothetical protein